MLQTSTGKELRLRHQNFGSFSKHHVFLREGVRHEHAQDILGATCTVLEDKTKVWYVKMPEFVELERGQPSLKTPLLEQDHDHYWRLLSSSDESALGGKADFGS